MGHNMLFQLRMARDWCIEVTESCPKEVAMIQSNVFNNTIHWHVGHILTIAERMLFNAPDQIGFLPNSFTKWFESGTRPDDAIEQLPDLEDLIILLKEQQTRILNITPEQFNIQLVKPRYGFKIYGECAGFVALHETLHIGKIEEMIRVISRNK